MSLAAKDDNVRIEKMSLGPYGTNTYIITCLKTGDSAVIDAPGDADTVLKALEGTSPKSILMTHDHMDHTGALSRLKSELQVPVGAHPLDTGGLGLKPDMRLEDGAIITLGDLRINVIHTPGHTPGSLCFLTGKYLIAGDTLFPGGPGHTRSPEKLKQIIESITGRLFVLPDETEVHPGHGDSTTIGREKENYAVFASKEHDPKLCGDVLWLSA